ncbi:S-adenosyl-L-methionine-dependent methyltransferase [Lophiostoma macrostomum CBS 122681]|uniref:Trimethylguanosine synthase n=1 Tax=Lophiostoma macrostomum CBS 122681 TaxID=1314788 RepID=A0A6A6TNC5_9PLEO|nr:S-adenosyl-L-methionine-dependent methyltransferase [Lophiostoma macrostomum CBS 122681]
MQPAAEERQWLVQNDFPEHLHKYWFQRHTIWSRFDEGICMTEASWYGVTPEPIANKIASHIAEAAPKDKTIIIDAFAGVGGNAIAFARQGRFDRVFAIEKDPKTMECAKHNAEIYGVQHKIVWITGDSFDIISKRFRKTTNTVIYASPPWGGTTYNEQEIFDLSKMEPYDLTTLYNAYSKISKCVVLYLPRSSDLNQLAQYAPEDGKLEVAHYCIKRASKALCAYFGDFEFGTE